MSFFRAIWKGSSKHKKLYDEWALAGHDVEMEEQPEEVHFNVKYIGSTVVESAASEDATAEAVKAILSLSKAAGKKMARVNLGVSLHGIKVTNPQSQESQLEVSIYRISYCSADATNSQVFAFIETNANESLECHAFLCPKRKVAQTVSMTVAQMFNTAFEVWQLSQERDSLAQTLGRKTAGSREPEQDLPVKSSAPTLGQESKGLLIDLDSTTSRTNTTWVNFDNDNVPNDNFPKFMESMDNGNYNFFPNNVNAWDQPRNLLCS